jgi:hypothetical protein
VAAQGRATREAPVGRAYLRPPNGTTRTSTITIEEGRRPYANTPLPPTRRYVSPAAERPYGASNLAEATPSAVSR